MLCRITLSQRRASQKPQKKLAGPEEIIHQMKPFRISVPLEFKQLVVLLKD
ncbi:MAG TPA: hypothetical protein ACFYD3_06400 [Candidatus Hypogeohydataceae bacterium YC41]